MPNSSRSSPPHSLVEADTSRDLPSTSSNVRTSASTSQGGKKRSSNPAASTSEPPPKKGKKDGSKQKNTVTTKSKSSTTSSVKKTDVTRSKSAEKPASQIAVISAAPSAKASLAPPTKSVGTSQSTNQPAAQNPSSAIFTSATPLEPSAACNMFMQALQTVFLMQNQGTLPARAGDTTGSSVLQSAGSSEQPTSRSPPARAGDSTGPRSSAPATVSRAPSSPGPVGLHSREPSDRADSAPGRQSRTRTRDRFSPRRREGEDIGSRFHSRAPVVSLGGFTDDEFDYQPPTIAARSRNWADDASFSSSFSAHSTRSESRESLLTDEQPPSQKESKNQGGKKDGQSAAELLIKYCPQLKAEAPDTEENSETKPIFCLDSELSAHGHGPSAVKLDTPFSACYNKLAHSSLDSRSCRYDTPSGFRFDNKDFNAVFSTPSVPEAAYRVGDARARKLNFNGMRSRAFRKADSQISLIDRVARTSMRLAAYQSYLITAQREADRLAIEKEDQKKISDLLLRISDLQFEQAARTALLCTKYRRAHVMEQLKLEKEAEAILGKLPYSGSDLFAGKFQQVLEDTIAASSTADKTAYKLSKTHRSFRSSGEQIPPRSGSFREGGSPQGFPLRRQTYNQSSRPPFDSRRVEGRERSGRPFRRPRGLYSASAKNQSTAPQRGYSSHL